MKLASYLSGGNAGYGVVTDKGVVDLTHRLGSKYPDLRALLAGDGLAEARKAIAGAAADFQIADLTLLPVIPNPDKIVCVGLNYEDHLIETGRDKTEKPVLFLRLNNSQVGANQPMLLPRESTHFDYEAEIAVIIGKAGRRISEQDSWNHVAGYSCYNDGSIRDWQRHTSQFTPGKNFKGTGAFGPWMVTADEIPPNTVMTLTGRLNGKEVQRATSEQMIFKIPALVHYISTFTDLLPGDVIVSGTPGGVGAKRTPPLWMKPGDTVEIEIDKVGVLTNSIAED
jgi:2-keto-4-pentenoate hydratase/2-oxohepta-3-ene-1,7-dioic acid hydratase in catechol pathway